MNYNLNADEINTIKKSFSAWLELQDEKENISEAERDLKKQAAEAFDGNASQAGKLFRLLKKRYDNELKDEEDIWAAFECILSTGSDEEAD